MESHYSDEIYQNLRAMEAEPNRRPLVNYMEEVLVDIAPMVDMRAHLVNDLSTGAGPSDANTIFLATSYIDRFLGTKVLTGEHSHAFDQDTLQVISLASMNIASKYEDTKLIQAASRNALKAFEPPERIQEIVAMEKEILIALNHEVGNPTAHNFLRFFIEVGKEGDKYQNLEFLVDYLAELSLLDYLVIRFLPSLVAASVVFLARFTIKPEVHPWSLPLQEKTGYRPSELIDCVRCLHELQLNKRLSNVTIVRVKYRSETFKSVSTLVPPQEIPEEYLKDPEERPASSELSGIGSTSA